MLDCKSINTPMDPNPKLMVDYYQGGSFFYPSKYPVWEAELPYYD